MVFVMQSKINILLPIHIIIYMLSRIMLSSFVCVHTCTHTESHTILSDVVSYVVVV